MCNFYGHKISRLNYIRLQQIEKDLGTVAALQELQLLKSGFVYGNAPVLRKSAPNDFEIVSMHWEFIPAWIKTMDDVEAARKQGIPWLNATCEKLLQSKMFRHAALDRRCLVLASHFFEWRSYKPDGAKKENKYPYAIELNDADYFFMAGIWQPWTDQSTGETIDCFAIVTTKANDLMEEIHNTKKRMPVILPEQLAWEWMMGDLSEERIQQIACYQLPSEYLHSYSIRKDFKALENPLEPFDYDELPPLDVAL